MIKKSKNFAIVSSKDILGGEPVFKGTRVPAKTLIEYIKSGETLNDFLRDYPTVTKQQAMSVLDSAQEGFSKG